MPEKNSEYRLAPRAGTDLEEIWIYTYENWSLDQANTYHGQIVDELENLARDPDRGRDMSHVRPEYRRGTVGSHFIFYRKTSYGIEVIRVLHHQRDIPRHL